MTPFRPLIALTLALTATSALAQDEQAAPAPRPVLSQIVTSEHATTAQFVGVVAPRVSANIAFRIGGTLVSRQAEVGQSVASGTVLATLDGTTYELAVQTARANLSSAEAQHANAAAAEARLRTLNQSDVVSLSNLEQAEQQTAGALAALVQAQARLSQTEEQLSYATLAAPFDGIITAVGAEAGSVIAAGQTVVTVADPQSRDVVIDVPESVIQNIAVGTDFNIAPQLSPQRAVTGKVREIAPQADPLTRSWRIKIGVDDGAEHFWLGTTASANLSPSSDHAIVIPISAIKSAGTATSVFVVNAQSASVSERPVVVSAQDNGFATVSSGIEDGDRIVVAGVNGLRDGQSIKLDEESAE